jgi:hypothetical protein
MDATYISVTTVAKLIRPILKRNFPATKFSVKSDKYSMGASIDIFWRDGPTTLMVETAIGQFASSTFDGMIDMKLSWTSWLLPNGTAIVADNKGTIDSKGTIPAEHNEKPHPDAKLVRFGSDYVTLHRDMSSDFAARALASAERKHGKLRLEVKVNTFDGSASIDGHDDDRQIMFQHLKRFISV